MPWHRRSREEHGGRGERGLRRRLSAVIPVLLVVWLTLELRPMEAAAGASTPAAERTARETSLRRDGSAPGRGGHARWREARRSAWLRDRWRRHRAERWCRAREASLRRPWAGPPRRWAPKPNIVVVLTDDQRHDSLDDMPATVDRIARQGVTFTNAFVTTPSCAPSRASMLTGRYAFGHGVDRNGIARFDPGDTVAKRLQAAGYVTGLVGKYMNYYEAIHPEIPPGWDAWYAFVRPAYLGYSLVENGEVVSYGTTPSDYSTDVLREKALAFIDENHDRPFFLVLSTWAPHEVAIGAPRHDGAHLQMTPWRPSSHNEADTSDKPNFVKWMRFIREARGDEARIERDRIFDVKQARQLDSLLAVDDAVDALVDHLERYDIADDTMIVFTSDNGFLWGEHWLHNKFSPYEESIRVPMAVRYPRMLEGPVADERMVLNIDLAPTWLELAGAPVAQEMDGRSLAGLLCGRPAPPRVDFLIEYGLPRDLGAMPGYSGLRSERWKYVRYLDGFEELYDLEHDPLELDNLLVTRAGDEAIEAMADAHLRRMREISTAAGE